MKFSYAGALVALTLASLLTACGGKAQYTVQGSVSGVTVDGLEISNGGSTLAVPKGATSFAFPQQIDYGSEYNITISKELQYFDCQVLGGKGTAGYTVTISAGISCTPVQFTVGGTYSGLVSVAKERLPGATVDSDVPNIVTLINGSGSQVDISSATASGGEFTVASLINGDTYSISILKQPNKQVCTLTNSSGVIRGLPVSNLVLTCAPPA